MIMFKLALKQLPSMLAASLFFGVLILLSTSPALAQETTVFKSLVGLPGLNPSNQDIGQLIKTLYSLAIIIGAMLAVIKIILGGVKYMFSGTVTTTEAAKADIKGALLGLLIIVGAVVILGTINPQLINLDIWGETTERQMERERLLENILSQRRDICGDPDNPSSKPCQRKFCKDDINEAVSCSEWCSWVGGRILENINVCTYPDDEAVIEAVNDRVEEFLFAHRVREEQIVFQDLATNTPRYFRAHFDNELMAMGKDREDFLAYFEIDINKEMQVATGWFGNLYIEKVREACTRSGGSDIRSKTFFTGGKVYYCYR